MKLIVGLGNPGREYEKTRHNFGFMVLDELARAWEVDFKSSRFKAKANLVCKHGDKILLLKPETFMNLSGESVRAAIAFYQLSLSDLMVIYDDLDLPLGRIRLSLGGSSGGHNGVESLIANLGTKDFLRMRLGIGKPPLRSMIVSYVLSKFQKEEEQVVEHILKTAAEALTCFLEQGMKAAMNSYNRNLTPGR